MGLRHGLLAAALVAAAAPPAAALELEAGAFGYPAQVAGLRLRDDDEAFGLQVLGNVGAGQYPLYATLWGGVPVLGLRAVGGVAALTTLGAPGAFFNGATGFGLVGVGWTHRAERWSLTLTPTVPLALGPIPWWPYLLLLAGPPPVELRWHWNDRLSLGLRASMLPVTLGYRF